MIFSDSDLQRLKNLVKHRRNIIGEMESIHLNPLTIDALIIRLEAAEEVIKGYIGLEKEKISYDNFINILNRWQKVSGK